MNFYQLPKLRIIQVLLFCTAVFTACQFYFQETTAAWAETVSWPMDAPDNYSFDNHSIEMTGGLARLKNLMHTDADNDPVSGFDAGTFNNTVWDVSSASLKIASGHSGSFTSRVFDAGSEVSWTELTLTPEFPAGKELPNNGVSETAYASGNADMSDNRILYHLNESSGDIMDNSGGGFNAIPSGFDGDEYNTAGRLNTALKFDGTDILVGPPTNTVIGDNANCITQAAWFKSTSDATMYVMSLKRLSASHSTLFSMTVGNGGPGNAGMLTYTSSGSHKYLNYNGGLNDGHWHHLVAVVDGDNRTLYIDGDEKASDFAGMVSCSGNTDNFTVGGFAANYGSLFFDGVIDETAVWNRALSAQEVAGLYRRGALRLKYQVRSDQDNYLWGPFIGPDGTSASYYSELLNSSVQLPALPLTNLADNRYFQYRVYFEADNPAFSPQLSSISVAPDYYDFASPAITNTTGHSYIYLVGFGEASGSSNQGAITYQISNNGSDWYYYDAAWVPASDHAQTNSADEIDANIESFNDFGPGIFYFKAFFNSDGSQKVELDRIALICTPTVQFSNRTASGSEAETSVNLQLSLSETLSRDVAVQWSITGGTAQGGGIDYTLSASGSTTVPAGSPHANIPLSINDDIRQENNETITITLLTADNATLGSNLTHTYTIIDNDENDRPQIDNATITPETGGAPLEVLLSCNAHDIDGRIAAYHWHFTDGTSLSTSQNSLYYTVRLPGTHSIDLVVTDDQGLDSLPHTLTLVVSEKNPEPQQTNYASLSIDPAGTVAASGEMVPLQAVTRLNGSIVSGTYLWELLDDSPIGSTVFDNGTFTAGQNYEDTYVQETVIVTDTKNAAISARAVVFVKPLRDVCEVRIAPENETVFSGDSIAFTADTVCGEVPVDGDYRWLVVSEIGSAVDQNGLYVSGNTDMDATDIIMVFDVNNWNILALATVHVRGAYIEVTPNTILTSDFFWIPVLFDIRGVNMNFEKPANISFFPKGIGLPVFHLFLADDHLWCFSLIRPQPGLDGTGTVILNVKTPVFPGRLYKKIELIETIF